MQTIIITVRIKYNFMSRCLKGYNSALSGKGTFS